MDTTEYVQLGPYTLKRRIGAGGMAEVWIAEREKMGAHKTFAIKLLNAMLREQAESREMFINEARLSMALNHSSIVQVFDVGEHAGECFITMEWVDGLNLSELTALLWQRGESMPLHVATYVVGEVLRALDYAHNVESHGSTGIVHRDVSPQNVMLSVSGEVKLMDFGVARFSSEHTTGNLLKGKIRYMPPEQTKLQSRDPTVDLFAVGAIFYELIENKRFRANVTGEIELLKAAMDGLVPPLSDPDAVPNQVLGVLNGLLEVEPRMRIGSARGALRMLSEWRGYRNAALELEAIVARHRRAAPRGEPTSTSVSAARQIQARIDAHIERDPQGSSAALPPSWRGVNAPTDTTLEQLGSEAVDDTSVGSIWARRTTRATRGAAVAVALLGLGLGSATVAFAVNAVTSEEPLLGFLQPPDDPVPTPAPPLAAAGPAEGQPTPVPRAKATDDPSANKGAEGLAGDGEVKQGDAGAQLSGVVEPTPPPPDDPPSPNDDAGSLTLDGDPSSDDTGTAGDPPPSEPGLTNPEPPKEPKRPKQKVKVTFIANQFRFVEIKLRSRQLKLQPKQTIELLEGGHTVKIQDPVTGEWVKAGRIRLRPGHSYEVRMTKPHGLQLIELD